MAHFSDYCEENKMLFSEDCSDSPADFPGATAYRVGSYSGSDNERKYLFPTPPDSPVFTELTPPNAPTKNHPGPLNGYAPAQTQMSGFLSDDCAVPTGAQPVGMDLNSGLHELLQSLDPAQGNQQLYDMQYNSSMGLNAELENIVQLAFPSDCLSDCSAASPPPNNVCDIDITDGDLPNLGLLDIGNDLTAFGMCSQDSDFDNFGSCQSLSIDEIQPSNYNSLTSSIMSHHQQQQPPPLYHDHHHNIQPYNQYYHTNQRVYLQHRADGTAPAPPHGGRKHNYQCRTLRTTLKDGVVTQEMTSPQNGPIMSGVRPRTQSTSSDDVGSDEEHVIPKTTGGGRSNRNTNRGRGRGREQGSILWKFIRDLLKNETCCPKFIRWENREDGVFKFVNSEAVASMWGRKKNNQQMTYEKLSRAMRYYYKRGILERVDGRRLVYKFGRNAEGWKEAAGLQ